MKTSILAHLCLLFDDWYYGNCSLETRRPVLPGRKAMTKLDKVLKSKDSTLLTKVHVVKAMVFPVITFSCESWTVNKAEHWRIDAFDLWCWRRLLRVPWTARRPTQSILKEINHEFSLEGLMLKLKLQYFDNLMRTGHSLGGKKKKKPDAGKDWRQKEKRATEDEIAGWHLWWSWPELGQTSGGGEGQGGLACYSPWGSGESDMMRWLDNDNSTIGSVFVL